MVTRSLLLDTCMTLSLVFITQISHSRVMDGETWIASDGRAYLVDLRGYSEPADLGLDGAQVSRTVFYLGQMGYGLLELRMSTPMLNLQMFHYDGMGLASMIFRHRNGSRSNDELNLRHQNLRMFIRSQGALPAWPSI